MPDEHTQSGGAGLQLSVVHYESIRSQGQSRPWSVADLPMNLPLLIAIAALACVGFCALFFGRIARYLGVTGNR